MHALNYCLNGDVLYRAVTHDSISTLQFLIVQPEWFYKATNQDMLYTNVQKTVAHSSGCPTNMVQNASKPQEETPDVHYLG